MPSSEYLQQVIEARIWDQFYPEGYTPTDGTKFDTVALFAETRSLVAEYVPFCNDDSKHRTALDWFRMEKCEQLREAEAMDAENGRAMRLEKNEAQVQKVLPRHAEILAVRFATVSRVDNAEILRLLARMNLLHLWQVPAPDNAQAGVVDGRGIDPDSDTEGTPTEADSSIENALKVGLADIEHKVKAAEDAKKDLRRQLAMAKSDLELLGSPMSLLAMDN